jgi:hypothetical protein
MDNCSKTQRQGSRLGRAPWLTTLLHVYLLGSDICLWGRDPDIPENPPILPRSGVEAPMPLLGAASMARPVHTVEELDDVGEVHIVVTNDLSVGLHQGQGNEQDKVL